MVTAVTATTMAQTDNYHLFIVYPMHLDRPSNQFFSVCQSVCVSVNRSVVERLRPQFFTDFHEILHAAQKSGRFVVYCL